MCCDWSSSPVIGMVLKEHFEIRNRITWQREKGRGAGKLEEWDGRYLVRHGIKTMSSMWMMSKCGEE